MIKQLAIDQHYKKSVNIIRNSNRQVHEYSDENNTNDTVKRLILAAIRTKATAVCTETR